MKHFLLLLGSLLSFALLPSMAWAQLVSNPKPAIQSRDPELDLRDAPLQALRLAPAIGNADNVSILSQVGNSNESYMAQIGDYNLARLAIVGNSNTTAVSQKGNHNVFDMDITGNSNPVTLKQLGDNNLYSMDLNASNTPVNLVQDGNNNRVTSNLAGNNRQYNISQYGNNNLLNQVEGASILPQGYSVEMRGNGIRLSIEQGRATH